MDVSMVVPCYNEESNVAAFYEAVRSVWGLESVSYEIIFVNDGSSDHTKEQLCSLYEKEEGNFTIVNFSRNFGKEAAILAGMKHAKGDYVLFIDADLQQSPETALTMYHLLLENPDKDSVCAYQDKRSESKSMSFLKRTFYRLINKMCEIDFVNGASDFRIVKKKVADAILMLPEYYRFSKGIFSWVGFETMYIPYEADPRKSGDSKWSYRKLFHYAMDGILGYSTVPLKVSAFLGILLSVIAIIYMIILVIKTLILGVTVPGYVTTLGFVLLIGGIQLLMLGIIGEYLARAYIEGKRRPIYIENEIWEKTNGK